jgi:hypothetical protein
VEAELPVVAAAAAVRAPQLPLLVHLLVVAVEAPELVAAAVRVPQLPLLVHLLVVAVEAELPVVAAAAAVRVPQLPLLVQLLPL